MRTLKLPRSSRPPRWTEPPAVAAEVALLMSRRQFLRALAVVAAALATPFTRVERSWAAARGRFFTAHERATLGAYADRIIPPDADPGAQVLGVAHYVENLLTAFDTRVPRIFAGGPFSGRTPYPDNDNGTPSHKRPRDAFKQFLPLTRLQELTWRAELFGSAGIPEVTALDAQNGGTPLVGLRDVYRTGLKMIDTVATRTYGKTFVKLDTTQQDDVFKRMEGFAPDSRRDSFNDIVIRHTLEGCFCAPEYGGNRHTRGWRMIGLEGDAQPLGYSIFDRTANVYRERADHPMTTANPDELQAPRPLSATGTKLQATIATLSDLLSGGET